MIPGKYNMVCPQGSTFQKTLTYIINDVAVNLTGYSAKMQVRDTYSSAGVLVQIGTAIGGITLNSTGVINLVISAATTATFVPKTYVYDVEIVSPAGVVTKIVEGKFIVTPEVTRT